MELLIFVFLIFIIAASLVSFYNAKIKKIIKNRVVVINNSKHGQKSLLLKKYAIPLRLNNSSQVEVVFPQLNELGELVYIYSLHFLSEIHVPNFDSHKQNIEFMVAKKLSRYIREHLETEK